MNKETKSKCCEASVLCYSSLPDFPKCSKCGEPFIPQEDTPVTPIEEKKLRYQINKIRNGCWRLEWEDGSFSEHSTQDGAEKMRMQIETSRASHPIEPLWSKEFYKRFNFPSGDVYFSDAKEYIKAFIHSVEKAAEERGYEKGLAENPDNIYLKASQQLTEKGKEIDIAIKALEKAYKDLKNLSLQNKPTPPITPKGTNQ